MPDEDAAQPLQNVPLLARLPAEDVRALASGGRLRTYTAGSVIFREGAQGDSLHVVVEGQVRCVITSPEGTEVTVATMGPGEPFGDLALLDGRPRSATAVAVYRTRTFQVTRPTFIDWLSTRPTAALGLLEELSLRIRRMDESLTDQYFLDLGQRLAKHLLSVSSGEAGYRLKVTQAEVAARLGVTRESVNKQLNQFERAGHIQIGRGSVTITSPAGLRQAVEGDDLRDSA